MDASSTVDAGSATVDAAPADASATDAAAADAALADAAASPDASPPDAELPDAGPDDCGFPGNLIANCGFETDISGWTQAFNATISHNTTTANSGIGSLQMEHMGLAGQSNWSARITGCIVLAANTTYTYGAAAREVGGSAVNFCRAQLQVFDGVGDCSGASTYQAAPQVSVSATWASSQTTFTASASGASARVHLMCNGGAGGSQVAFDDVHLEP